MYRHILTYAAALLLLIVTAGCRNESGNAAERPKGFTIPALGERHESQSEAEYAKVKDTYGTLRGRIEAKPQDVEAYTLMAQLFMQEARLTGRHHEYIPSARALLDEALRRSPEDFLANVATASLLMTLHRFNEAEGLALRAVARNHYSAYAFGVLCDARVELGKYDDAVRACDSMNAIRPDLRSYARISYIRELFGDRAGAIDAMKMAADAGVQGDEDRAWALYNLGNLFLNQGKLDTAKYIFNGILEERPNYGFALSGLAAVDAARGDYADAIAKLVDASQRSPEHLFIEQLSDIYVAMGDTENARTLEAKALDAFALHEKGGWNIDREYAIYCANHNIRPAEALERAGREYERRPENIDVLDTYAWTLYRNGRAGEAVAFIERALAHDSVSDMLRYHAGMIYKAVGNRAKAAQMLTAAFHENPYLRPIARAEARKALAEVGGRMAGR